VFGAAHLRLLSRAAQNELFRGSGDTVQPVFWFSFCFLSHVIRGWKYSRIAEASARSSPVIALRASGQGLDCPMASMAANLSPAGLES